MADTMMLKIDGREFEFPVLDTLTFREARMLKNTTGLKMGQFGQALEEGDVDMILGMALLALMRSGEVANPEALLDLAIEKIEVIEPDETPEDDAPVGDVPGPPDEAVSETASDEAPASDA